MWIGNDVRGIFHEQFELHCGLKEMIQDEVMTKFEVLCRLEHL
jgi:hypothetical protein